MQKTLEALVPPFVLQIEKLRSGKEKGLALS